MDYWFAKFLALHFFCKNNSVVAINSTKLINQKMKNITVQVWYFDRGLYINEATGQKMIPEKFYRYKRMAEKYPGVAIKMKLDVYP
jgi:hypothetical protein